ncbi:hypothetical protein HOLleu_28666 [Holothuria leucospilota]|uniref:Uncharacterized protein n=1 Tax=Holothuria leucospilota TaxID=206669 RepID=A0A9Q1BMG7_HOLLE|nr:hypothetical protein HOLleu_28666 [Holothuria leucospilota]
MSIDCRMVDDHQAGSQDLTDPKIGHTLLFDISVKATKCFRMVWGVGDRHDHVYMKGGTSQDECQMKLRV